MLMPLILAASLAWPWTTPEDCQREYETKAAGKWSLNAIHAACRWKYGENQTAKDSYIGACVLDRIDEPRSDTAFRVLFLQCGKQASEAHPNPFDQFDSKLPELPAGCLWDEGAQPGMFDDLVDADAYAQKVNAQTQRCARRNVQLPEGFEWIDETRAE